ncbi:BA14K family protein [Sphingobium naphthae]|uniref:BA14K family protein n=1 Tax=Sphingobium naphthae TaxID=1886786 RepID=A0ABU3ZR86_9SPHN|nr:BA14K family protein [Sphingobium naphthae]MDV5822038.1 BA14K family protein [Sphingobium naphthae]
MMSRSLLPIAIAALVGAAAMPAAAAPQQNHDSHSRAQTQAQSKVPVKVAAKSKAPVKVAAKSKTPVTSSASKGLTRHQAACRARYRSYDIRSDTYNTGKRRLRCKL